MLRLSVQPVCGPRLSWSSRLSFTSVVNYRAATKHKSMCMSILNAFAFSLFLFISSVSLSFSLSLPLVLCIIYEYTDKQWRVCGDRSNCEQETQPCVRQGEHCGWVWVIVLLCSMLCRSSYRSCCSSRCECRWPRFRVRLCILYAQTYQNKNNKIEIK